MCGGDEEGEGRSEVGDGGWGVPWEVRDGGGGGLGGVMEEQGKSEAKGLSAS